MRIVEVIRFFFIAGMSVTAGCLPATWTETPRITGRVVTSEHLPVPNASVTVDQVYDYRAHHGRQFQLTTDAGGYFIHAEETRWQLLPFVPIDSADPLYAIIARVDGQQSKEIQVGGNGITGPHWLGLVNNGNRCYDLHDLVLEQASPR